MSRLTEQRARVRRFNARGNMMLALVEGLHRAGTALGRVWRAWTARLAMSRRTRVLGR